MSKLNLEKQDSNKYGFVNYINLEDMEEDRVYKITLNPSIEDHRFLDSQNMQGVRTTPLSITRAMKSFISGMKNSYYKLYFELAPTGRPHFHGIFKVYDVVEFYLHTIPKLATMNCCLSDFKEKEDKNDSLKSWLAYCMKQQKYFSGFVVEHDHKSKKRLLLDTEKSEEIAQKGIYKYLEIEETPPCPPNTPTHLE